MQWIDTLGNDVHGSTDISDIQFLVRRDTAYSVTTENSNVVSPSTIQLKDYSLSELKLHVQKV